MNFPIAITDTYKNTNILFTSAIFLMAILLHQSQVVFGVNISFADLFCIFIFMVLLYKKQLVIPVTAVTFFLVVSILVLITSVFFVPFYYMYNPELRGIISEYAKLLALFLYFTIGFNLSNHHLMKSTIKWYSIFGILMGGIGILFTFLNIRVFSEVLFYAGTRFRGLMIDPNYFSILQITALAYISRAPNIKTPFKFLAIFITVISVLTSGSKTGIITLFCYFASRLVEYLFLLNKKAFLVSLQFFFIVGILIAVPFVLSFFQHFVNALGSSIPSFERVSLLFTDFGGAISGNGSGRDITWKVALQVIQQSPIFGIGIGTYSTIAFQMFQSNDIPHNTFLQLSAEWGIPLALILFSYIFILIGKATVERTNNSQFNFILRDIILILLIGSMAISLNNARILWLVLGALAASLTRRKTAEAMEVRNDTENFHLYKEKKGDH